MQRLIQGFLDHRADFCGLGYSGCRFGDNHLFSRDHAGGFGLVEGHRLLQRFLDNCGLQCLE